MMNRIHHITIVLTITLFLWSPQSKSQSQFRFEHLHRTDGLANEFVDGMSQDSLGYIWFHWPVAISRYDGYSFKVYKYDINDSLRKNLDFLLNRNSILDHHNQLWFREHHPSEVGPLFKCARYDWTTDSFTKYEIDIQKVRGLGLRLDMNDSIIWIGSDGKGLFKYSINSQVSTNYQNIGSDGNPKAPLFIGWLKDLGSSILMTSNKGLWLFEKETKKFSRPPCLPKDTTLLWSQSINAINNPNPKDNTMWFRVDRDVIVLDESYSIIKRIKLPELRFRGAPVFDKEGVCWLASSFSTKGGVYRYDYRDSSLVQLKHDPSDPHSLSSDDVNGIMVDVNQNVWMSTDNGINVLRKRDLVFYNKKIPNGRLWTSMIYTSRGIENLLVDCSDGPENYFMLMPILKRMDSMSFQAPSGKRERPISLGGLKGKKNYWAATLGTGVLGYPINLGTGIFSLTPSITLTAEPKSPNSIVSNRISKVWEDRLENLWVGNQSSDGIDLVNLNVEYGSPGSVTHYKIGGGLADDFLFNNESSFFVKGDFDLNLVHVPASQQGDYRIEPIYKGDEILSAIFKSGDGTLFLSTPTRIYSAIKANDHYQFDRKPFFEGFEAAAMLEDNTGRLWTYGDDRLVCFNRKDTTYTIFDERDGINHFKAIEMGWFHKTANGFFITVDPDGVTLFDPNTFQVSHRKTRPLLTQLEVNNHTLIGRSAKEDPAFITEADINVLNQLTLDYQHNNFTLEFSAMEMTAPEKNLYQHKLEGYDEDWIETDYKNRTATYTNLPAGEYTFRVKASNHHGVWSDNERTLKVIILPPPWRTWWAYLSYSLIVITLNPQAKTFEGSRKIQVTKFSKIVW